MAEKGSKDQLILKLNESDAGSRLDLALANHVADVSRTQIKQWIDEGLVTVDGRVRTPSHKVSGTETVTIIATVKVADMGRLVPAHVDLDVLHEDEDVLVINKHAGLVVHPGAGVTGTTLLEGVLHRLGYREGDDAKITAGWGEDLAKRPGIVHRLDKDTSGVMVIAKNRKAHQSLADQFRLRTNLREYLALVDGTLDQSVIEIATMMGRDPANRLRMKSHKRIELAENADEDQTVEADELDEGPALRFSKTRFATEAEYSNRIALLRVKLYTGRTHQVRVHASDLSVPVVGDSMYGRPCQLPETFSDAIRERFRKVNRQMLHARVLGFAHPRTGEKLAFEGNIPSDFKDLLEMLRPFRSDTAKE
jgi:23S rRNA pseudouridine1911/1915/1917 synthase